MRGFKRSIPEQLNFIGHFYKIENFEKNKKIVRQELMSLTNYHCSYCDCKLHLNEYTPEIEHFIPLYKRASLKNAWFNLFVACPKCNSNKNTKYPKVKPLKPDDLNFDFDKYFIINFETGELIPNPKNSENIVLRVYQTINWLDLNDLFRCKERLMELDNFKNNINPHKNILDWSYVYFLERGQ